MNRVRLSIIALIVLCCVPLNVTVAQPEVVISSPIPAVCGDVIENEFLVDYEVHKYTLTMQAGDLIEAYVIPVGSRLSTRILFIAPNGEFFGHSKKSGLHDQTEPRPRAITGVLSANGVYEMDVSNWEWLSWPRDPTGVGVYTIYIGCTLKDGTVIRPGERAQPEFTPTPPPPPTPAFSGFGFPGLPPRDFSTGIELPLTLGLASPAPIGSDVVLYTYSATAGEIRTLKLSRMSGDISIGVTVIHKETNELVFFGGMPASNTLSVELTFPSDGVYAFGLFRVDTPERMGSSGAVQLTLE